MANQYWIQRNDRTVGPFALDQIRNMASTGMLTETDLVSSDQVQFKPAGEISELFPDREPTPPSAPTAATQLPAHSQADQNLDSVALTETESACDMIHFQCRSCDKPIEVGQEWAGQKFECSRCGKIGTVPNGLYEQVPFSLYDQVPFYQKQGFFWLMYFLATPIALAILLFGDVYYLKNGKVKSFGLANKIIAGLIAVVILFRIFSTFAK